MYILLRQVWVSPTVIVNTWSSSMCILPTYSINSKLHCHWHWRASKGMTETFMVGMKKWHAFVDTTSMSLPLCRYKRNPGRHKWSSGKSLSELHFRMYWYMKPALFGSSLPILRRSLPICGAAAQQTHVQKNAPKVGVFFRTHTGAVFPAWWLMLVYTETSIVFTIKYLHVLLVVKRNSAYGFLACYTVSAHTEQISL